MAKKALKLTLKIVAGFVLLVMVLLALFLWRLSSSPMQLDSLIPKIEQSVSDLPGGFSFKLKGVGLFWNRDQRKVDLKLVNVDLLDQVGTRVANSPEIDVSLSVFALMRGVVALSSIELRDVGVRLVRSEDGTFRVFRKLADEELKQAAGPDEDQSPDLSAIIANLFRVLASKPDHEYPLSYLKRFKILGDLEVEDRMTGLSWSAHTVDSLFTGQKGVIKGDLGVSFSAPEALAGVSLQAILNVKESSLDASLDITGLQPSRFAAADQRLASLAGLDMTIGGVISTSITLPDTIHSLEARLKSAAGQFSHPQFYPTPIQFNSVDLQLSADLAAKSAQLSSLDVALGEAGSPLKLHVSGSGQLGDAAASLKFDALLQQLKVIQMDLYWPETVAQGARKWLVSNLQAGEVENAKLNLEMLVPTGPGTDFQLTELKGALDYSELSVAYYGSLPVATGVSGSGTYDRHGFDLGVSKGLVNGVSIDSGTVLITGMDNKVSAISIATHLSGGLRNLLAVLEAPPLELSPYSDFSPNQVSGQFEADFNIALPLRAGLSKEEINYQAAGKITGGSMQKVIRNFGMQAMNLDFQLHQSQLKLAGPLEFAGIPLTVDWTSHLVGTGQGDSEFTVDSPLITSAEIKNLGYDLSDYLQGSIALKAAAKLRPGGISSASINADLTETGLSVPKIYWSKPLGDEASVSFTLLVKADHSMRAQDIEIELGTIKSSGKGEFDFAESQLTLEHLAVANGWMSEIKLNNLGSTHLGLSMQGGELNLQPYLSVNKQNQNSLAIQEALGTEALRDELVSAGIVIEIENSRLDKVFINENIWFDTIQFSALRDRQGLQQLSLSGHNPFMEGVEDSSMDSSAPGKLKSGQFSFDFGPVTDGRYPLRIEVENLGSLVSAVEGRKVMEQGYLVLNGHSTGTFLRKPIQATFEVDYFTVKEAPAFAEVLNLASLSQISSTFSNTGLVFNTWSGDLELDGARLSSKQMIADGGRLGWDASGWVDLKQGNLDVSGALVPLNNLGKAIGVIPLVGKVLAGTEGKGVIAFEYMIKGTIGEPKVTVHQGFLGPGILRNILNAGAGDEGDSETSSPN